MFTLLVVPAIYMLVAREHRAVAPEEALEPATMDAEPIAVPA